MWCSAVMFPCYAAIITSIMFGQIYSSTSTSVSSARGLIAYDCASPEINMTSYSLLDVASCLPPTRNISTTEVSIQVLQRNAKTIAKVYQCRVIIKRAIRHCGMHSHTSDYERGFAYIVKEFTSESCQRVHMTNLVPLTHNVGISEARINTTTRGETLIVGYVGGSNCKGGTYRTPEYTWTSALVYYNYEITLHDYVAKVDLDNDQIFLRNGLVCQYSSGRCLDSEEGYLTWDVNLNKKCEDTEFEIIYEGEVNKTSSTYHKQDKREAVIYTTISQSHLFSIRTKEPAKICGYNGFSTDHPRIFIIETTNVRPPFHAKASLGRNNDIFTYFNSKITMVENYVGQKLNDVYNTIMMEMCKLDKTVMETKLTLARLNPAEFATSIIRRSGYTAVVAGEVLYVLECKPVYVTIRSEEACFQEIPVLHNNRSMFLAPVTRILQQRGTEIDCTPLIPAKFMLGNNWYTADGRIRETTAPKQLTTDIVTSWSYTPLPSLMESGVYDSESVSRMRNLIYEQGDNRIASSIVHKVLAGQHPNMQGFHFDALVSERIIDTAVSKYWTKILSWSTWLGNITSTAIGIYMIARLAKFLVDTMMHGRILFEIYGFGWQLLASFWDSVTAFLSHRNSMKNLRNNEFIKQSTSAPTTPNAPTLDSVTSDNSIYPLKKLRDCRNDNVEPSQKDVGITRQSSI